MELILTSDMFFDCKITVSYTQWPVALFFDHSLHLWCVSSSTLILLFQQEKICTADEILKQWFTPNELWSIWD